MNTIRELKQQEKYKSMLKRKNKELRELKDQLQQKEKIEKLQNQLQQKENIIKEVREYANKYNDKIQKDLLEILDKENNNEIK